MCKNLKRFYKNIDEHIIQWVFLNPFIWKLTGTITLILLIDIDNFFYLFK